MSETKVSLLTSGYKYKQYEEKVKD